MDRLERLQRMLLPSVKTDQPTCTFDVEELRGLVFRGISESDTSSRGLASSSGKAGTDTASDVLRPLAWRLLLGVVKGDPREWPDQLQCRRDDYHMWKRDLVGGTASQRGNGAARTEAEHHSDISLMKEIEKDVFRTRSELPLFSGGGIVQQQMLYILFVFSRIHSDVGYIQGMNEVLAPIIYVCSCNPATVSASEVEADAYLLFAAVMASLQVLYTRTPENPLSGADLQMTRLAKLLRQHDAALWQHLNSVGLTPDLYSFRWYMTLLAREFPMPDTLRVWDALLADPKRFSFLHYVNCALVRSQRSFLLLHGFTTDLKRLQNLHCSDATLDIRQLLLSAEEMRQLDRNLDQAAKIC
ncbi:TBC1 domain family member 13 protein [Phytophthora cinnamomi]|uniref:TBC1 domain family member 13 protein n=1 Tax=Phytophthora cinnamomi TaxID=4785 RepID=UPI003559650F|nr:TBC1 domain family member 13 protein [Phytophthora cinnamomi]